MKRSDDGNRVAMFVAGYRWSGSSAVCEWLEDFGCFRKPRGCETSFGEIRAFNYGLMLSLAVGEGRTFLGDRLARKALHPESRGRRALLGPSLNWQKGPASPMFAALDALYMVAVSPFLNPKASTYGRMLDIQLGCDHRGDAGYRGRVSAFVDALRNRMRTPDPRVPFDSDPAVRSAVSALMALFYDRLRDDASVPIFDNAISGLYPERFDLVGPAEFQRQVILLVHRDPRDQFAELVKYSPKNHPWMVKGFIRTYRALMARTEAWLSNSGRVPGRMAANLSFEAFVCDTDGCRSGLRESIGQVARESFGTIPRFEPKYDADASRKNIGVWRKSGLDREMRLIERELPEYLRAES